jgi:hypothetical protein
MTAGNVNTGGMMNAPAVDLLAAKGSRNIRIAVKTTEHGSQNIQWGADKDWTTLFKGDVRPDFVVFVWFNRQQEEPRHLPHLRGAHGRSRRRCT